MKIIKIYSRVHVFCNRMLGETCKNSVKLLSENSVALVRERTIPTDRPPSVGEVSANFCG